MKIIDILFFGGHNYQRCPPYATVFWCFSLLHHFILVTNKYYNIDVIWKKLFSIRLWFEDNVCDFTSNIVTSIAKYPFFVISIVSNSNACHNQIRLILPLTPRRGHHAPCIVFITLHMQCLLMLYNSTNVIKWLVLCFIRLELLIIKSCSFA